MTFLIRRNFEGFTIDFRHDSRDIEIGTKSVDLFDLRLLVPILLRAFVLFCTMLFNVCCKNWLGRCVMHSAPNGVHSWEWNSDTLLEGRWCSKQMEWPLVEVPVSFDERQLWLAGAHVILLEENVPGIFFSLVSSYLLRSLRNRRQHLAYIFPLSLSGFTS